MGGSRQEGAATAAAAGLTSPRLAETMRVYRWIGLGLAFYVAAVWSLAWGLGVAYKVSLLNYLVLALQIYLIALVAGVLARLGYVMAWRRPSRLLRHLAADFGGHVFSAERLALALPVLVGMPVAMSVYSSAKRMIPDLVAYRFDVLFWQWDRWLHFGTDPWRLMQPLLGTPWLTSWLSLLYHQTWLALMIVIWIWQAWSIGRPRLRLQFLITYLLVWIVLGNVGAVLLSSAGPPYYAEVTGLASPFVPLFDYLGAADGTHGVWAVTLQEMLWRNHTAGGTEIGTGISAMPSVHVATTVVFCLVAWRHGWPWRLAFTAYAAVVVVGSVQLGWHYAVDAYVSILLTWLIWRGVGWTLRRHTRLDDG